MDQMQERPREEEVQSHTAVREAVGPAVDLADWRMSLSLEMEESQAKDLHPLAMQARWLLRVGMKAQAQAPLGTGAGVQSQRPEVRSRRSQRPHP